MNPAIRKMHEKVESVCWYSTSMRRTEVLSFIALVVSALGIIISIMLVTLHVGSEARTALRIQASNTRLLDTLRPLK